MAFYLPVLDVGLTMISYQMWPIFLVVHIKFTSIFIAVIQSTVNEQGEPFFNAKLSTTDSGMAFLLWIWVFCSHSVCRAPIYLWLYPFHLFAFCTSVTLSSCNNCTSITYGTTFFICRQRMIVDCVFIFSFWNDTFRSHCAFFLFNKFDLLKWISFMSPYLFRRFCSPLYYSRSLSLSLYRKRRWANPLERIKCKQSIWNMSDLYQRAE